MNYSSSDHIIVSGAGVAGLAAAYWFAQQGVRVTVIEKAPRLRAGGHAVDFRGQAVEVLRRMGLLDAVVAATTGEVDTWYVDVRGRRRASLPQEVMGGDIEILRGDLIRILADAALAAGAVIRFGVTIESLESAPDATAVRLDDGELLSASLIVAADGLHSRVRELVFGGEGDFLTPLGYAAAVFATDNFLNLDHAGRFYSAPGRTAGVTSDRDASTSRVTLYFADETSERPRTIERQRELLREHFVGEGWVLPDILARLEQTDDLYFDQMAQVRMERYSHDRVVLLGDAGYAASPLSGMGTSLAMIGAYVLMHELATSTTQHGGLAAYEQRMRPLVSACQKLADGAAQFFIPSSRAMIALRNVTYRAMPHLPWKGVFADIPTKAANSIALP